MTRIGFVPGFKSDVTEDTWTPVLDNLISHGFDPYPIRVRWQYTTMEDNVEDVIAGYDTGGLYGHSFGALACLYASVKIKPDFVIASSPSPYLAEYIEELDQRHREDIGKRRTHDFRQRSIKRLTKVQWPVYLFHEKQSLMRRVAQDIGEALPSSHVQALDTKEHNLLEHYESIAGALEKEKPLGSMDMHE